MTLWRRLVLLVTLMFWQGGFMFYGAVVVPVGSAVLGSDQDQGFITRPVTNYLNGAGALCLVAWGWDLAAQRGWRRNGAPWCLWCGLVAALAVQGWLHLRLDELLDVSAFRILDRSRFRWLHQWYLIASTLQWAMALGLTYLTLRAWQRNDSAPRTV